ncbi:MAG: 50S ribosomal protein L32 [Candidatus Campbellbacteria bacterium]|nr:50S ribosomal protein L32 [Candidatus Campbellbacteria bacterium]
MSSRMRLTKSKTKMRRSHSALKTPLVSVDSEGNEHISHRVCPTTGKYKGRQVFNPKVKKPKKTDADDVSTTGTATATGTDTASKETQKIVEPSLTSEEFEKDSKK